MDLILVVIIATALLITGLVYIFYIAPNLSGDQVQSRERVRQMVNFQRGNSDDQELASKKKSQQDDFIIKSTSSDLTLQKKLKYAQLSKIPPYAVSISQAVLSLVAFLIVRQYFGLLLQLISLGFGPIFIDAILMWRINKRFERFDVDYPQFLMSLVGLLKTGMNPVQALGSASEGLDESSLLREEVLLMLERMKLGVSEDSSIGAFGEDINHPEIELFVQALLLSRRVGGTLSDTLERLAKQVRKRQFFRRAAQAAVALQRGSINMILAILMALEGYLFFAWRAAVTEAWYDASGRVACEFGLFMIIFGYYWSRQVSKIRT